jgi:soluble cytochrome b562
VQFKVEEAKLQLQGDILVTKQSLTKAEKALAKATRAYPFDPKAIVEAQVEVEGFQDGLKRLEALNSLF